MILKQLIKKITIHGPREFTIETTFLPKALKISNGVVAAPDLTEPPASQSLVQ